MSYLDFLPSNDIEDLLSTNAQECSGVKYTF